MYSFVSIAKDKHLGDEANELVKHESTKSDSIFCGTLSPLSKEVLGRLLPPFTIGGVNHGRL